MKYFKHPGKKKRHLISLPSKATASRFDYMIDPQVLLVLSGKVQRQQTLTPQGRDIEEKPQDNKRKRQY